MLVTVISGRGATVGDNILTQIIEKFIESKGHITINHFDMNTNLVVFGAGGLIWENTYLPILLEIEKCVKHKKKCVGIGLGVQGFYSKHKYSFLKKFETITVRNIESKIWMENLLDVSPMVFPDLMFTYDAPVVNKEKGTLGVIHPNIKRYPLHIRALKSINDFKIRYIPFQLPAIPQYQEAIKHTGGKIVPEFKQYNPLPSDKDIIREVAKCEYVIAGHYHGVISAFLTNTPCIVLPLRDKIRYLMRELDCSLYQAITDDEIRIKLKTLENYKSTIVDWMKRTVKSKRLSARQHLTVLNQFI